MAIALIAGESMRKRESYEEIMQRIEKEREEQIAQAVSRVLKEPEFLEVLAKEIVKVFTPEELEELKSRYQAAQPENYPAPISGS